MGDDTHHGNSGARGPQDQAIRFLVESAIRKVASNYTNDRPRNRDEWVERFCEALMSEAGRWRGRPSGSRSPTVKEDGASLTRCPPCGSHTRRCRR